VTLRGVRVPGAIVAVAALCAATACATPTATSPSTPIASPTASAHAQAHAHGGAFQHRFDDPARWSKEFDDPARDAWQKPAHVVALLELAPGMTVVDLGAGTGYFEPHLSRAVGPAGRVVALDVEEGMASWIRDRAKREGLANVEARAIPADDPRLEPGRADRILVVDTWHHVADRERYARKLAAALAPGGRVVVVDFTKEATRGPPPAHRIPADQVVRELEAGGLEARIVAEELPEQYVVAGTRR
jgi:cyclopropane fatty-acyl-phospholipid synthase-like methyltransferase